MNNILVDGEIEDGNGGVKGRGGGGLSSSQFERVEFFLYGARLLISVWSG